MKKTQQGFTSNSLAEPIKEIYDRLLEKGIIKNQNDLAEKISIQPRSLSNALNPYYSLSKTFIRIKGKMERLEKEFEKVEILIQPTKETDAAKNLSIQPIEVDENPLIHFIGKHNLLWAKFIGKNLIGKATVEVTSKGKALFQDEEESVNGTVEYKDRALHFCFWNRAETFYLILDVGSTFNKAVISHLAGILVAVDARDHFLYSSYALLCDPVRQDQTRIDTYFEYAFAQPFMKIDSEIKKILDERIADKKNLDVSKQMNHNLKNYLNKNFYLYAYEESNSEIAYIGRHILKIGVNQNDITLINLKDVKTAVDYIGYVVLENQFLVFRLRTVNEDKYLDMRFRIGKGKVHQYALGTSLGVEASDALANHTLILEYDDTRDVTTMTACAITPQSLEYQSLNKSIKTYFQRRENNYIKLTTKPILSDGDFKTFFERQKRKNYRNKRISSDDDFVFIGYPMDSIVVPDQRDSIKSAAYKISAFLEARQYKSYIESKDDSIKDLFKKQSISVLRGLIKLEQSNTFLLLFPRAVVSSVLIEFGFALQQHKRIYVCYQNLNDLPWMIQNLPEVYANHIERIQYSDIDELLSILATYFPEK